MRLAFIEGGEGFVSAIEDGTLKIWDLTAEQDATTIIAKSKPADTDPDDAERLVGTTGLDAAQSAETILQSQQFRVLRGSSDDQRDVTRISFNSDSSHIAAETADEIRIWNVSSGELETVILHEFGQRGRSVNGIRLEPESGVRHLCFDPAGNNVAACNIFSFKMWDRINGQLKHQVDHRLIGGFLQNFAFSTTGEFVGLTHDRGIQVWRVSDSKVIASISEHVDETAEIRFALDDKQIICDAIGKAWDVATGLPIASLPVDQQSTPLSGGMSYTAVPVGEYVLLGSTDSRYLDVTTKTIASSEKRYLWHERNAEKAESANSSFGAMAHFTKCLQLDPSSVKAWIGLQLAYAKYQASARMPTEDVDDELKLDASQREVFVPDAILAATATHVSEASTTDDVKALLLSAQRCFDLNEWYLTTGYFAAALRAEPTNLEVYFATRYSLERLHREKGEQKFHHIIDEALAIDVPLLVSGHLPSPEESTKWHGQSHEQQLQRLRESCAQSSTPLLHLAFAMALANPPVYEQRSSRETGIAEASNAKADEILEMKNSLEVAITDTDPACYAYALKEFAVLMAASGDFDRARELKTKLLAAVQNPNLTLKPIWMRIYIDTDEMISRM
jgi:WD40 repeat protein